VHKAEAEGRPVKILLYCHADLNLIDGSSIWTSSIAQVLARHPGAEVTLPLKRRLSRSLLTGPLEAQPNIKLFDPWAIGRANLPPDLGEWVQGRTLRAPDAAGLLAALDRREGFDLILVRGLRLAGAVVDQRSLQGRIWVYLTDFTDADAEALATIHARAERFLCQTRQLQEHVQRLLEVGPEKFLLLLPMIPDFPANQPSFARRGETLVYVGKFAPRWRTEEMAEVMSEVRGRHPSAELHVAGDKIHDDPGFPEHMRELLERTPGLIWHKAMTREQTQELIRACDVGCSWREPDLDGSLELSTKVLEYGSHGKPVLLNRIPIHEELLGSDYPLFCNTREEYLAAIDRAFTDDAAYSKAARAVWEGSRQFTFSAALQRLSPYLPQPAVRLALPRPAGDFVTRKPTPTKRTRIVLASHDWKFFRHIMEHIGQITDFEVRVDEWKGVSPSAHDESTSTELTKWADIVVAEWCLGNAVWYSKNLGPESKLIIRLHRFELDRKYPDWLDLRNVHRIVAVSPVFAERVTERLPSLRGRVVYIPNTVDCDKLDQPKMGGSEFRLGILNLLPPRRKRPDLALDIFERLRRRDTRYVLSIKTQLPTVPEYRHIWQDDEERQNILALMARINQSPWRDSVYFEPFGHDVHIWLRKIGFVLSTSDDESFHMSVAEGMASGAVPVIRSREEVPGLYPAEYVFSDIREAVDLIERIRAEEHGIAGYSERLKAYVRERYDAPRVAAAWEQLIRSVTDER
jgi:glycosyltransferase involved in cell wall biosynthesis